MRQKDWVDVSKVLHRSKALVTFWQGKFHMVRHENNKLRCRNRKLKSRIRRLMDMKESGASLY